jgi:hypothetical protein
LVTLAGEDGLNELRAWLEAHPAFYDLTLKSMTRALLQERLRVDGLLELSELPLELVAEFFDFPLAGTGGRRAVGRAILLEDTRAFGVPDRAPIRQLKRKFAWPQVLWALLLPGVAPMSGRLAKQFFHAWGGVPPGIDVEQAEFFGRLVTPGRIVRTHGLLAVATLVISASLAIVPWWLVGLFYADAPPLVGFVLFLFAMGGLAGAALLTVSSAWLWQQLWSGLTELVWRHALLRRLPVAFAVLAPAFSELGASPQLIAFTFAALYWWRIVPAVALLASSSLSFAMLFAPDPPMHPVALGAASVPALLLMMDALYAKVHGVTLRQAFGNRWTLVCALSSVPLAVLALTRLNG